MRGDHRISLFDLRRDYIPASCGNAYDAIVPREMVSDIIVLSQWLRSGDRVQCLMLGSAPAHVVYRGGQRVKILDVKNLVIPEIKVIRFARFADNRGYFTELFKRGLATLLM